jgi:hypothetical protein
MPDTNVRVVFSGSSGGARRASDETADGIKKIGTAGREAAHGVDEIRERAEAGTRAINEERRAMDRLKVASLLGGAATGAKWGIMAGGIAALGTAAIGTTAALAPLAGSVAVLPGLMTAAGLAFGTLKLATDGLSEALKGNKKALAALTPAGRAFVETLKTFEPVMERLRTTAQKGLFPGLLDALNKLKTPAFFATINKAVGEMAVALGNVARQFGQVIGSQKFMQTFSVVAASAAHWMQQFGTFAVKSFDAMMSLTRAAIPLTNWMGNLAVRFATFLDNQIKAAAASGKLQGFFEGVRKSITLVGHTLGSLGLALFDVGRIAKPFGDALLQALGRGSDAIRKFVESAKGHAAVSAFFGSVGSALRGLAPIAGALLAEIANVVPHLLNALGDLARALAPALVSALKLASGALSAFYDLLGAGFRALGPVVQGGADAVRVHMSGINEMAQRVVSYFRGHFLPPLTSVMRSVGTAGLALVSVIRANWPQISSVARSMGSIVASSLKLIAAASKDLGPIVRALGPLFHAAGIVASVAMRGLALLVRGVVASMIAEMRAVGFAAHAMAFAVEHPVAAIKVAWAGLRTAATHVIKFLVDTALLKAAMGAIHALESAWRHLASVASHVIHFFTTTSGTKPSSSGIPAGSAGRAAGGFIPGPQGSPVTITAHGGEVIVRTETSRFLPNLATA